VANGTCSEPGCSSRRFAERRCWVHLAPIRLARGDLCSEPGCDRPRQSSTRCAMHGSAASRRQTGGPPVRLHGIVCVHCGEPAQVWNHAARFCSNRCWGAWQSRPVFGPLEPLPCTEIVHVDGGRLRRPRPAPIRSTGKRWIAGRCRRCDEPFVLVFPHTHSLYCSKRCSRADAKDRRRAAEGPRSGAELVYRRRIFERDGWRCQLCGKKVRRNASVPDPLAPTIDHIVPVAEGGSHEPANVQCAHFRCNCLKSDGVHGAGEQLRLVG
jgi:5-methylcytosine-specific restriction endonuclease McrA